MLAGTEELKTRKRLLHFEEGVSSYPREPFFASKRRLLYLQTIVFTPLSIRRGVGGEAVVGLVVRLLFERKKRLGEHIPSFGGAWGGFFSHIEISLLHDRNTILCVPL